MAKIAFILLVHKDPDGVVRQARSLAEAGDCVAVHFDASAPEASFARIRDGLQDVPGVVFARRRVRCGWGEWSLVAATLEAVRAARAAFPDATHYYMISGDCMAIKSAEYAHEALDAEDADHIESFDFFESGWIKTGLREDRLIYRHLFNERTRKKLFYASLNLQRRLGLRRAIPQGIKMMIGSQWWCLRRDTIDKVLEFCKSRPDVVRFFRTTWIPDETFFQTLVRQVVPAREIRTRSLTFLSFTDYGMPTTFHNDHHDFLLAQDCLFARKISAGAVELRERLGQLYLETGHPANVCGEGRKVVALMTGLGREGRRFAPRIWEEGAQLGAGRTLHVLVCKKWHVAKRLAASVRQETGMPALDYIFDEDGATMPDLGGIERGLAKRSRHRRAVLRMVFDHYGTDRLLICLDPARADLIEDCVMAGVKLRVLEIRTDFSDDYLAGHARRVGMAGETTPAPAMAALVPAIRRKFRLESDRMAQAAWDAHAFVTEHMQGAELSEALARFLAVPVAVAGRIAETPTYLPIEDQMAYSYDPQNIFARILRGEIPNKTVIETEHTLAFHDIGPQAPIHVLVIPKGAYVNFDHFATEASAEEIADFTRVAGRVCHMTGAAPGAGGGGYRTISNAGEAGVQEVPHYHLHVLGGRVLGRMLQRQD